MNDEISRTSVLCKIDLKLSQDVYTNLLYINLCNVNVLTEWFVSSCCIFISSKVCQITLLVIEYDDFLQQKTLVYNCMKILKIIYLKLYPKK